MKCSCYQPLFEVLLLGFVWESQSGLRWQHPTAEILRLQHGSERDLWDVFEEVLIALMAGLQVVVGDAFAKVMNVVIADIGRKPLQERWQFQEACAFQGSSQGVPSFTRVGITVFKDVLYVKHINQG